MTQDWKQFPMLGVEFDTVWHEDDGTIFTFLKSAQKNLEVSTKLGNKTQIITAEIILFSVKKKINQRT